MAKLKYDNCKDCQSRCEHAGKDREFVCRNGISCKVTKVEKGATAFDKLCHKLFDANSNGTDYLSRRTGVKCGYCAGELEAYYCESRLYVVECPRCKTKALVMAVSAKEAAYNTFGHEVFPIDEMGEETAVFFHHTPIDEPPCYIGSTIDADFPEQEVVCGMYLPNPGTDGTEENPK